MTGQTCTCPRNNTSLPIVVPAEPPTPHKGAVPADILQSTWKHALTLCKTLSDYLRAVLQDEAESDTLTWANACKLLPQDALFQGYTSSTSSENVSEEDPSTRQRSTKTRKKGAQALTNKYKRHPDTACSEGERE